MAPTALTYVYTTSDDLDVILSMDGVEGRIDDTDDGVLSTNEILYRSKAIYWATARVNFFCLSRYAASDLAQSWLVNDWCTILATYKLSLRRGNPVPGSLIELRDQAEEDMKLVHSGAYEISDIAQRNISWPAWSNVRVDVLYNLRRIRVERPISDQSSQSKFVDVSANYIVEPNA